MLAGVVAQVREPPTRRRLGCVATSEAPRCRLWKPPRSSSI